MNPRLISALKGLKKEALLLSPLIWPQSMTTAATRKNGSWQDTTRCCGALSRKKLSVIIHRFPEMQGNIIHVDYERSSWRYMNYERSFHREDLDAFKIGGTSSNNRDTIEPYLIGKGGGSAYGGEIKPSKNQRMSDSGGEPGETKYTYTAKGELIETLIGPDGKAYLEIHHTNHGFPKYHEVPHQHSIIWDQSGFHFGKEQTTKSFLYGRNTNMATWVGTNSL